MRLAVISDIHGNLAALEAVLADIRARGVDRTVNLGDCITSPLWPKETFEALQSLALPTVRGNHDRWIEELPEDKLSPADRFARDALTAEQRLALHKLPAQLRLDDGILACHGTKRKRGWNVELLALEYDWEAASARALANNRPEWAQAMLSGYVK